MSHATVLVVDDDSDARVLLELALAAEGLTVTSAVNGADALRVARRSRPDVILLDLAMPIMDGFAFRAAQLVDPQLAGIPVICVSGRHDVEEAVRRLKMAACVPKPFCLTEVIQRVHDVLSGSFSPPDAAPAAAT
jgi:DNA-binding response OmpR family regulator